MGDLNSIGGKPEDKLPNIEGNHIMIPAFLMWKLITNTTEYKRGKARSMDGRPGHEWRGSVNNVIETIYPDLTDRYLINREDANAIKVALNRYLRNSRNLICVKRAPLGHMSTWWVADMWTPVETRNLQDKPEPIADTAATAEAQAPMPEVDASAVFDVPVPEPTPGIPSGFQEPVSAPIQEAEEHVEEPDLNEEPEDEGNEVDGKLELPCRFEGECSHPPIESHQGRAIHERKHGIRVNRDGSVTTFDPKRYGRKVTSGEIHRVLIDVCKAQDGLTMGDVLERAMATDPTITKDSYRRGITRLLATPFNGYRLLRTVTPVEDTKSASTKRYSVERVTPTPKEAITLPKQRTEPGPITSLVDTIAEEKRAAAEPVDAAKLEFDIKTQVNNLLAVADYLEKLESQDKELKELRAGLDASSAKNRELVEKIKQITAERDELQKRFDTLKSVFS